MYECVGLNKRNRIYFEELNKFRYEFNTLNEDFFEVYNKCNFAEQIFLRRRVKLLKYDSKYIGYIWSEMNDKNSCCINSISVLNTIGNIETNILYKTLVDTINRNCTITYLCESNNYNCEILKYIGFRAKEGTLVLYSDISQNVPFYSNKEVEFEILQREKDEQKRCEIQNEVFRDDSRVPLTIEDIYFDQVQSYYFDKGAVFLKKDGEYIGYGQIIIEDNIPIIVNFGILKEYRGNGYSKAFLSYLLKIIKDTGFEKVKIKVKNTNIPAVNLYEKLGFKIKTEVCMWELKR